MFNYSKFNDKIDLNFYRISSFSENITGNLCNWSNECGYVLNAISICGEGCLRFFENNNLPLEANLSTYLLFIDYYSKIIEQYKNCESKKEIVRFCKSTLRIDPILSDYYETWNTKDYEDGKINEKEYLELHLENYEARNKLKEKISDLLLSTECFDEYFELMADDLHIDNFFKANVSKEALSIVKYPTLLKINEAIERSKENVLELSEKNIALDKIKDTVIRAPFFNILLENKKNHESSTESDDENFELDESSKKLLEIFDAADEKNSKYPPEEYYQTVKEFIEKHRYSEFIEKDAFNRKAREIWDKIHHDTEFYKRKISPLEDIIKEELLKREDNYAKGILLLSTNYSDDEKKMALRNFFTLGYNNTKNSDVKEKEFGAVADINKIIDQAIDDIFNNETIVNQIVAGEHLFNKISSGTNNELKCDYTFLVASQIKSVERFIKETILKNMCNQRFENKEHYWKIPSKHKTLDELKAVKANDDYSHVFLNAELGALNIYLSKCFENNNKKEIFKSKKEYSIFKPIKSDNSTPFNSKFIKEIRNGHFHTSMIESINDAQYFRIETAFWLLCVIHELKGL